MSPLRIAAVLQTPRDEHSAVLIGYLELGAELAARGHSFAILTPDDFPLMGLAGGRWTPLSYPVAVAAWTRRHASQLDVIVSHSYAAWLALASGATRGTPVVVAFHGLEPMYHEALRDEFRRTGRALSWRYRLLQERLMPAWLRIACRRADRVLCLNAAEREYLQARGWAPPDGIETWAHGVPDAFFETIRMPREVGKLLFVGQWLAMKGTNYLRDAAVELLRRHAALRLVCAGTLVAADDVHADFPEDVRARVSVRPRVDRDVLPQLYADADVFVFPSLYEGFGRALLEAMASGLPIVTTRVGVAADALSDDESCIFVAKHDAAPIVHAVERLIESTVLRVRLGGEARDRAAHYREAERSRALAEALLAVARQRRD